MAFASASASERFFTKVDARGICWEWTAYRDPQGYGRFMVNKISVLAHRWCWEYLVGPVSEGLHLDHLCRNRSCVNPDHLEPVTPKVNSERAFSGRRRSKHCKHGHLMTKTRRIDRKGTHCHTCKMDWQRTSRLREGADGVRKRLGL